jgi:hypothetical protein
VKPSWTINRYFIKEIKDRRVKQVFSGDGYQCGEKNGKGLVF